MTTDMIAILLGVIIGLLAGIPCALLLRVVESWLD